MTDPAGPVRLLLAGPTGIGKTALAVELAQRFPFEIISADSMQIYRGLEIGTAQPTAAEHARARFHGCGELDPAQRYDAQQFLDRCAAYECDILARGRLPLYVGGTGLYLRALRWGLAPAAGRDPQLRAALQAELVEQGGSALHARLAQLDPASAVRIHPTDPVRLVRALEIITLTGRPLAETQHEWTQPTPRFPHRLIVLIARRDWVRERIASRTRAMLRAGWVDEVRQLLAAGHHPQQHCFKALGYREILECLAGQSGMDELEQRIITTTQQFAKRQMVWFRKERPAIWLRLDTHSASDPVAHARSFLEKLLAKLSITPL